MAISHATCFEDYKAIRGLNASLLASSLTSWAEFKWQRDHEPEIDPNVTRVGTAAHSVVEYLPRDRFGDYFCVRPDFHLSPDNVTADGKPSTRRGTKYCKKMEAEFDVMEERTVLSHGEYQRLDRILQGISGNPRAMELIKASRREVTVTGDVDGVPSKGRVDGIGDNGVMWDLKTCHSVDERAFSNVARRLRYLFKDAFRALLLANNGVEVTEFSYIVALDERVAQGARPIHAPVCVVVDVPIVALENYYSLVHDKIAELKLCEETGRWPGMDDYVLQLDTWDMPEVTLVD